MRRAFDEFLLVPTCVIAGFLLLAGLTHALDRSSAQALWSKSEEMVGEKY